MTHVALATAFLVLASAPQGDPAVSGWIAKLGTAENEAAIAALVQAGKPAVNPLLDELETGQREVAWQAMRAIRTLGPKAHSGKARLVGILRNAEIASWHRGLAAAALGSMPSDAVTAVDPLVATFREAPVSELQILSACALVEIGEPSGAALGRALSDKDWISCVWSANLLAELGAKATKARLPLQKLVQSDQKVDSPLVFLLHPSVCTVMHALETGYEAPVTYNELLRKLQKADPKKYGVLEYQFHGGELPIAMLKTPALARELLATNFGIGKDDAAFPIALPAAFEDWDHNEAFSVGELVQGLGNHVAAALRPLRGQLEADSIRSWAQWEKDSAELRGLLLAVHALTRPEFLERSGCLESSTTHFEGLYPRGRR